MLKYVYTYQQLCSCSLCGWIRPNFDFAAVVAEVVAAMAVVA